MLSSDARLYARFSALARARIDAFPSARRSLTTNTKPSKMLGRAEVTASRLDGASVLSHAVHVQPLRVQPVTSLAARRAGAAAAVIGSVGGGLLADDEVHVFVTVDKDATLWLGTQASTKVYKRRRKPYWDGAPSRTTSRVEATVKGLLVWAPDPVVPYRGSAYQASSHFDVTGELVSVEWLQAGRARTGERWAFESFETRTEWLCNGQPVVEALVLDASSALAFDISSPHDVAATIAVVGVPVVADAFRKAAAGVARRRGARVKVQGEAPENLAGDVVMGVSTAPSGLVLVRIVAEYAEDIFLIMRDCLAPLERQLGFRPYADRVHGSPRAVAKPTSAVCERPCRVAKAPANLEPLAAWLPAALQLADSALPTGGFAHSGGLEAAYQLGAVAKGDEASLVAYAEAAAVAHVRLYAPFAKAAAHEDADLAALDARLERLLAAQAPARLASRRQAAALRRVRASLVGDDSYAASHGAVAFGALARALGLPAEAAAVVFAHAATRDAVSAAVRLGIVGPLTAIRLQAAIVRTQVDYLLGVFDTLDPAAAATTAPLLDAVQTAHELLDMRLFQS